MKRKLLAMLAGVALLASLTATPALGYSKFACDDPVHGSGTYWLVFWSNDNFTGNCIGFNPTSGGLSVPFLGDFHSPTGLDQRYGCYHQFDTYHWNWNDCIQSIQYGGPTSLYALNMYNDANYGSWWKPTKYPQYAIRALVIGIDQELSSFKVTYEPNSPIQP